MKKLPIIAIAGATGLIGNELVVLLEQLHIPYSQVRLFASEESVGEFYKVRDDELTVELLTDSSFEGVDLALFALPEERTKHFIECAIKAGAWVVDTSRYLSQDTSVPLIVPEVNIDSIDPSKKLAANPCSVSIQLASILKVIQEGAGIKRVVVSTYQACSSAGKIALDELWEQTRSVFNMKDIPHEAFQHQIAFNCIPQIDVMLDNGITREEKAIIEHTRRVLNLPELSISATAVRVPVFHSDAVSPNVETIREMSPEQFVKAAHVRGGLSISTDHSEFPLQVDVANSDDVHVGRIRADSSVKYGLNMWVVCDNIRKGAALNAMQIVKYLIDKFSA